MTLDELLTSAIKSLESMKDAAAGSFVYFLYGQVFHKKNIWKGLTSFLIGTICAMYIAPQISNWFPTLNYNFVVFITGLLGMKITEVLIDLDYKYILTKKINQTLDIDDKKN